MYVLGGLQRMEGNAKGVRSRMGHPKPTVGSGGDKLESASGWGGGDGGEVGAACSRDRLRLEAWAYLRRCHSTQLMELHQSHLYIIYPIYFPN